MKAQTTIKDIAKALNISPSTVSRALKDHPDISQKTKDAVNQVAEELDYHPNTIAQSLRKSRSNTIGVVVPELVHHFFASVISGIEDVAYKAGYRVVICQTNEDVEREKQNVSALISSRVDGILCSMTKETRDFKHFKSVQKRNIPLIFFDRIANEVKADSVVVQDYEGAFQAVEHLISQGCRRIAHFKGPDSLLITKQRINGFHDAMREHKLPVEQDLIIEADNRDLARATIRQMVESGAPLPDGIFCVNDNVAVGALLQLREMGVKVPEQVKIIGFEDDVTFTQLTDPQISSVVQPSFEMGQLATHMFLDELARKESHPDKILEIKTPRIEVLKTKVVVRGSSCEKVWEEEKNRRVQE
ncbi:MULTISPECIES: LacI family DNA-binding transcriptional regulator [Persicobacter]|uniref:LacI family transcriptional regulator n=1 Tax=Persicobacter diffluens TaxID=981 RepID=A0AAN4VWY7_9BACT|nr:LacI family DNA-binding transcriptional regulator [Persicobacter sp. CCB-QB2]GJM60438.1 LacI family transcriptional regulator [Persicobacter diffluens]